VNVGSVEAIIEGIRQLVKNNPDANPKLVTAASGTIFEGVDRSPQDEDTEPSPHSPYAQSKSAVI
jgi:GDP-D-mannose dehydratase